MLLTGLAGLSLFIWIYLIFGRGGFWRVWKNLAPDGPAAPNALCVAAIVPARNEADVIAESVASLLNQDFPSLELVLVDDSSTDGTAGVAAETAKELGQSHRLTVLSGKPLVPGWTGKLWALSQGVEHAVRSSPDYLFFTDADIRHSRDNVRELVNIAEAGRCDLASFMVRLANTSFAEKALIPAFVFFFLQLYPPAWTASRTRRTAGAAGGCILIRPEALARIGGLLAIRNAIIDDCALARAVKQSNGKVWMGLTSQTCSIRSYGSFGQIGEMISRTAFNQLNHSTLVLIGTVFGLLVTYIIPPVAVVAGTRSSVILGALAWILMASSYWQSVKLYRQSPLWCPALPLIALFYLAATINSAVRYWRGSGGKWKGRIQDVRA